ncbi:hypothetical protein HNY73_008484 [Argiope bruennichi]|uniref:Uncharacterized protein n=1 Tax=Argiope bruennichi TaxID=94029 RepID=A0A8T0F8W2_ARGBR|nr:hypothetical protein HNY73_008484 [Argiope bruennichi]
MSASGGEGGLDGNARWVIQVARVGKLLGKEEEEKFVKIWREKFEEEEEVGRGMGDGSAAVTCVKQLMPLSEEEMRRKRVFSTRIKCLKG